MALVLTRSTGETLITVARAVAAQYANVTAVEHVYPLVRSQKQLDRVLDEIEEAPGIVLKRDSGGGRSVAGRRAEGRQNHRGRARSHAGRVRPHHPTEKPCRMRLPGRVL
jgi:hypothetical protein